jgi:hypothetical protein
MAHKQSVTVILTCLLLVGCAPASCSHTANISRAATEITKQAEVIKNHSKDIISEAQKPMPDPSEIVRSASAINSAANSIESDAKSVAVSVGNVEDAKNQWVNLLEWVSIAAVVIGAAVLSWYWGLGNLLRPLFARVGAMFASDRKRSEAKPAADVIHGKADPKELVSVMRLDPVTNELFKKEN